MQKAKADAALSMTIYQKNVEKTRNQTVEAKDHHEAKTESEDEEYVCEEEEALKQQLGSPEKDIKDLNTTCAAQVTEIEKMEKSFHFRQTWARAEFGEEWQGNSPAPPVTEAENPATSIEMEQ